MVPASFFQMRSALWRVASPFAAAARFFAVRRFTTTAATTAENTAAVLDAMRTGHLDRNEFLLVRHQRAQDVKQWLDERTVCDRLCGFVYFSRPHPFLCSFALPSLPCLQFGLFRATPQTGKSLLMRHVAQLYQQQGWRVLNVPLSGRDFAYNFKKATGEPWTDIGRVIDAAQKTDTRTAMFVDDCQLLFDRLAHKDPWGLWMPLRKLKESGVKSHPYFRALFTGTFGEPGLTHAAFQGPPGEPDHYKLTFNDVRMQPATANTADEFNTYVHNFAAAHPDRKCVCRAPCLRFTDPPCALSHVCHVCYFFVCSSTVFPLPESVQWEIDLLANRNIGVTALLAGLWLRRAKSHKTAAEAEQAFLPFLASRDLMDALKCERAFEVPLQFATDAHNAKESVQLLDHSTHDGVVKHSKGAVLSLSSLPSHSVDFVINRINPSYTRSAGGYT